MGEIFIIKPVINPYVVGDPVQGHLFVELEDVIRQLKELWVMGNQLQSIVLYGHRQMGKTSILLNAANCLDSQIKLAYVNLLPLGDSLSGVKGKGFNSFPQPQSPFPSQNLAILGWQTTSFGDRICYF
ncbi:hypothetical protein [Nostoc sp. C117]|uniref:hypothetical protein n=1 Tax=Nostoc sp. C117 TaxID=3349875 RepID=UPI00370D0294